MENPTRELSPATHQRIAEAAGVSRSTVSRALQNSSRISETTRQRVRETSLRLGYRPNPLLSALMERIRNRRSDTFKGKIAVITDREEGREWHLANPNWARLFASARDQARTMGFELENFSTRDFDTQGRRLSQILITRGIQGVLVAPGLLHSRLDLEWDAFSAVSLGHCLREPRLHRVCNDNFGSIQMACRRLLQMGYRRPGLWVRIDQDELANQQNRAGFLLIQEDCIAPRNRIAVELVHGGYTPKQFLKWISTTKPDVVLASRCEDLAKWAGESGRLCPRDIGFVDLDHSAITSKFAGVDLRVEYLGRLAIDLIIGQIQRNETGVPTIPSDLTLEGFWRDGASVRTIVQPAQRPVAEYAEFASGPLAACLS